jgi:hypothetical protein
MIMVKTIKPEWTNTELINILRWEDDGGKIIETHHLILDPPFVQSVPINEAMHNTSRPWKQHFVIESFQPGAGIGLIKSNAPIKSESPERVTKHMYRD